MVDSKYLLIFIQQNTSIQPKVKSFMSCRGNYFCRSIKMLIQKGFGHNMELLLLRRRKKVGSKACSSGSRVAPQQATGAAAAAAAAAAFSRLHRLNSLPPGSAGSHEGRLTSTRQAARAQELRRSRCAWSRNRNTPAQEKAPPPTVHWPLIQGRKVRVCQ